MRALILGILSGIGLATLRAPLGVDLFQLPAVSGTTAYGFRAAALGLVAVGLLLAGRRYAVRPAPGLLLLGVTLGFGYRGLVFEPELTDLGFVVLATSLLYGLVGLRAPKGTRWRWPVRGLWMGVLCAACASMSTAERVPALVGFGVAFLLMMAVASRYALPDDGGDDDSGRFEPPPRGELSGIALCGAGATIALEGLARHLRLLGGGLPQDDALFGTVLLLFAALGAGAFAQALKGAKARDMSRALSLCLLALAAYGGFRAMGNLASPRGLDRYLRSTDEMLGSGLYSSAAHGTLLYGLVIALPVLALPGVAMGAALRALRGPIETAAALLGAAVGCVLVPVLMGFELETSESGLVQVVKESWSSQLLPAGLKLAALGAVFAIALGAARRGKAALIPAGIAIALGALSFLIPLPRVTITAPWLAVPPSPSFVLDTPGGLLTVEPSGDVLDQVTLDRRPISPPLASAPLDRVEFQRAFDLLDPRAAPPEGARVLLVGQLTPGRALTLADAHVSGVDRTASWHLAMPALESQLFADIERPLGEILSPAEADQRLARGDYQLVIVPSVRGQAPVTTFVGFPVGPNGEAPQNTLAVAWLDASSPLAPLELTNQVLAATGGLNELAIGLAWGAMVQEPEGLMAGPSFYETGRPGPERTPLERLRIPATERAALDRSEIARRLAGANPDAGARETWEGLAVFYAGQKRSSPYERAAARIELPETALELWSEAMMQASAPDSFQREVIDSVAILLRGKRWIDEIGQYLAPIAERHAPWARLENALAHADIELLDPETAVQRLQGLAEAGVATTDSYLLLGEALAQAGDERGSADAFWSALERWPNDRHTRRRLAIQLVRAGDPEGRLMVEDLLLEQPDDHGLEPYLGPGPYPELPRGLPPTGRHTEHDH